MTEFNAIPPMTDPLGRHWRQPAGLREALMDDTHVILTQQQLDELSEYSSSMPSGVYHGKCWKWLEYKRVRDPQSSNFGCLAETGRAQLRWYGVDPDPGFCKNEWRWIIIV